MTEVNLGKPERRCRASIAHVLGWAALAAVNAVFIARLPLTSGGLRARAEHHLFDAGQLLAAGFVVAVAAESWRRFGPRHPAWRYLAVAAAGIALGLWVLPPDLVGLVADLTGQDPSDAMIAIGAAVASLIVPAAEAAPLLLPGAVVPWLGVAAGLGLAGANNLVLKGDYQGIHILVAVAAATLIGASLSKVTLPAQPAWTRRAVPRRAAAVFSVGLAAAAAATVVVPPRQLVWIEIFKIEGAAIAPLIAMVRAGDEPSQVKTDAPSGERRNAAPDVPASTPPLVGPDTIVALVTMDSVRAELLQKPEYAGKLGRLRDLANESAHFIEARSVGAGTVVTFASLFSGKHHFQLKWRKEGKRAKLAGDRSVRFPELLARSGVRTVTFTSYPPLLPGKGLLRGFDEGSLVAAPQGQRWALAQQMMDAAVERVQRHERGSMFLFLHLMDPHHPYDAAGASGSPFDRYVAETGLCSDAIGRLIDALKEKGLWDKTVLIVAADHGEGFNKHQVEFHNLGLYEEILHVPLLIRVPGVAGRVVATPVSTLDIGPTILDLYGLVTPGFYMGQSLVPFLRGQTPELTRPIIASTLVSSHAMYSFPTKVIVDRRKNSVEVYDLVSDRDERRNLADSLGDASAGALRAFIEAHRVR
jgi:hypothetical protein